MLAAFPPPGLATPTRVDSPARPISSWPQPYDPSAGLDPKSLQPKKKRRCCGLPCWGFFIVLLILLIIIAAAVLSQYSSSANLTLKRPAKTGVVPFSVSTPVHVYASMVSQAQLAQSPTQLAALPQQYLDQPIRMSHSAILSPVSSPNLKPTFPFPFSRASSLLASTPLISPAPPRTHL
jgi:hypothetical protein